METFLKLMSSQTVAVLTGAVSALLLYMLIYLIKNGKLKHVGKDGVDFEKGLDETSLNNLQTMLVGVLDKHLAETTTSISTDMKKMQIQISGIQSQLEEMQGSNRDIKLDLLRLQIISEETDEATKLKLYDSYKEMGGNSYIKKYMKEHFGVD